MANLMKSVVKPVTKVTAPIGVESLNPEVVAIARRRQFSASERRRILAVSPADVN